MNLFNKNTTENENTQNEKTLFTLNKTAIKYGSFSLGIVAITIAAVIILNVIMSVMVEKGLLKIDLSNGGLYTISEENVAFIEGIDKQITITVLSDEASYTDGTMNRFSQQYKNVVDDSDYYTQTVNLIKQYTEINENITVKFESFNGSKAQEIYKEYANLFYGDIYIEIADDDGKVRNRLVTFDDIYSYSDSSGYAAYGYPYYIDANNVETAVTSAINILISNKTAKMALLANHSVEGLFDQNFAGILKLNGFETVSLENIVSDSIPEDVDTLAIVAPESDFLPEELDVLNKWLDNDGKRGHSLLVFPGNTMANLSNLNEFLEEWGISYGEGTLFETNKAYCYTTQLNMQVFTNRGETQVYKAIEPTTTGRIIVGTNLPIDVMYDEYSSRKTNVIISTNDSVALMPAGSDSDWTPSSATELKSYPNLVVTEDTVVVDNVALSSYVAAFSSYEFIYGGFVEYTGVQNLDVANNTATFVSGIYDENKLTFVPKTIEEQSFADVISESDVAAVNVIFVYVLPAAIIILGVVVWIRRKRK